MGLIHGAYDAKAEGLRAGRSVAAQLHERPRPRRRDLRARLDARSLEAAIGSPTRMAFMFETRLVIRPTRFALEAAAAAARLRRVLAGAEEALRPVATLNEPPQRNARPGARRAGSTRRMHPASDFPVQNLPFAVFRRRGSSEAFRGGVAIGDQVLDLAAAHRADAFSGEAAGAAASCSAPTLNAFMAMGPAAWSSLRLGLSRALREGSPQEQRLRGCLLPQGQVRVRRPGADRRLHRLLRLRAPRAARRASSSAPTTRCCRTTSGCRSRYHGRSSSIGVSGQSFPRPFGQTMPPGDRATRVRSEQAARLRARGRRLRRRRQRARAAGRDRGGRAARLRPVPAERLVGARHPGVGVPAARAVSREELRDARSRRGS